MSLWASEMASASLGDEHSAYTLLFHRPCKLCPLFISTILHYPLFIVAFQVLPLIANYPGISISANFAPIANDAKISRVCLLSRTFCGGNRIVTLSSDRSVIRSKADYGNFVYGSTLKTKFTQFYTQCYHPTSYWCFAHQQARMFICRSRRITTQFGKEFATTLLCSQPELTMKSHDL